MKETDQFALAKLRWLDVASPLEYPDRRAFGATGYRDADGIDGLFSIYIVLLDGEPGPEAEQHARIFALAEERADRLPKVGERFIVTAGTKPVAHCTIIDRGTDLPSRQSNR